jgi:hypothetical protein
VEAGQTDPRLLSVLVKPEAGRTDPRSLKKMN